LALKTGKETGNKEALLEGLEMIRKKMYNTFESEGLIEIQALGKPFDPKLHEAALKVDTDEYPDGTVIEEIRKGFILKGKVIRPSMVKIAASPTSHNDFKSPCKVDG
jgi:molecular chaperone GrpE